ncbi:FAD-dependent oxidoreductase [Actinocorallia longicatena]|uniref:FAD-dependent oxidoreductase n=1 Tax=Actinocorallia longicatena TaxID=111803 RepID=A0ABP6QKN0_9ACTN
MADTRVVVIGAGATGLTLAVDLARRGVEVVIFEKGAEPFAGSRGKGLQPRTLEVFDDLGVVEAISAIARPYPEVDVYDGENKIAEHVMSEVREATEDVPHPNLLMLPQWKTEEILRERLAGLGVRVSFGREVTGFEQDEDGVTVALADGETVRASYLVGADGGRSLVRKSLGIGFEGDTFETERMIVGDVRAAGLGRDRTRVWVRDGAMALAMFPLPGTDHFQFMAPLAADDPPFLTDSAFDHLVGRVTSGVTLKEIVWRSLYRVNIRMAARFRSGRVFLAGDAAHVHSPAGGQGLNTGVQDAYNLGWKLAAVLAGAPAALLDTYEAERLPVAAGVLGISTALYRRAGEGQAEAFRRGEETQQLGLAYPHSPLSEGPGSGLRAPNVRLADGRELFDLLRGPHATLLAPAGHPSPPAGIKIVAVDEPLRRAFGITSGDVLLIRPDGYVGFHGTPGKLESYLPALRTAQGRQPGSRPEKAMSRSSGGAPGSAGTSRPM